MQPTIAITVSHPIAYFCAQYAEVARMPGARVIVLFSTGVGVKPYRDTEFNQVVDTGITRALGSFEHEFLTDSGDLATERNVERREVWQRLDAHNPAAVVVYGMHRSISRYALLWAIANKRKTIYIADSEERGEGSSNWLRQLKRPVQSAIFRGIDAFFAVGSANEAYYLRRGVPKSKIYRIPFPIDRAAINRALAQRNRIRAEIRGTHHVSENDTILLCSGKLIARKRQADIIDAVASANNQSLVPTFIGSGPGEAVLKELARSHQVRAIFGGYIMPHEMPRWYIAADLYVHASVYDPHPLAISEAVYAGLPAIVSDCTGSWGPNDDVRPGVNGFVYKTGDISALATLISCLSGDRLLRERFRRESGLIGQSAQEAAHRGFFNALKHVAESPA